MLAGIIPHLFFCTSSVFKKCWNMIYSCCNSYRSHNNKFPRGGGFPTCDPLENISTPSENMLIGTTTSIPIHFSSSLYLFFTFPPKKFQGGGGVVEPPPPLIRPCCQLTMIVKKSTHVLFHSMN